MADAAHERPSRGRWYILLLISVMYLITYLDRVNISTAAPQISKEFGFDKVTMGVIFSAFVWAYALFQVPGGWLSDRFGARKRVDGRRHLLVDHDRRNRRSLQRHARSSWFDSCSASAKPAAFPGATRAMQLWYPQRERGFVQGITHSASRFGAAIAPPIVVLIMSQLGWRWVFFICGVVGLLWALWWSSELPQSAGGTRRLVNKAELESIRGRRRQGKSIRRRSQKQTDVPWGVLLRSPNMWAIMCAYFTYVYCLWIFLSWLPSYLVEFRHFTLIKVGLFASLPLFAGVVGDTVGGLSTDWLLKKTGSAKIGRRTVAIIGLLGCAVCIVPAALTENAYVAVYGLTASMFFLEFTIGPSWAVPMDTGGKYSGTVSGMMNMAGNFGGRDLADRLRRLGPSRFLAGALHRRRGPSGHRRGRLGVLARSRQTNPHELERDPEKWQPVFRKDHAQSKR